MRGGWSPILGILGLDPILEGAIACDVSFFVALKTFMACAEGMNWFRMVAPVPNIGGLGSLRKS